MRVPRPKTQNSKSILVGYVGKNMRQSLQNLQAVNPPPSPFNRMMDGQIDSLSIHFFADVLGEMNQFSSVIGAPILPSGCALLSQVYTQ